MMCTQNLPLFRFGEGGGFDRLVSFLLRSEAMKSKRSEQIHLRVSPREKEVLQGKADEVYLTASEYLRRCGLNRKLPKPKGGDVDIQRLVRRIIGSFNTLSRRINRGSPKASLERAASLLREDIQELSRQLEKSSHF